MNQGEHLKQIIDYWLKKAHESLEAAQDEMKAGRFSFSVKRLYYACFYVASAVLLQEKLQFRRHSGVRAAFHRYFVKSGLVIRGHGQLYDELFEARRRGDYIELVRFEKDQVEDWLKRAGQFVEAVTILAKHE